ncbi:aldose epimerase family protein [Mariluticola halotolerans]|uniref:aldose epimerase family protein n=1 Tax=Mariluticola halotolerans TaxID=2909283 RepID=UPI0026E2950C|nr:aldose epimerase family protein [Mariluticola halotolerans]UJQ93502.1 galactose mutarotase [Mariluticola halotolerans]
MAIPVSAFGEFEGQRVDQAVLQSDAGVVVSLTNWGVNVRDWQVPVAGGMRSVVLGFDSFSPYPEHSPHLGSLAGRVANRIAGSRFELNGKTYDLVPNTGPNHLHGGPEGIGRKVWAMEPDSAANAVKFTLDSPDGAMGYPGNVHFEAVYTLEGKKLKLALSATTDAPTPISLVQHQYFNLGTSDHVLDHHVQLASGARTLLGEGLVPTGEIVPVAGTDYDFRAGKTLYGQDGKPVDYDLNYVLDHGRDLADPVAIVTAPDKDLTLKLWTDRPGLQLYNSVTTDVPVPGLGGKMYKKHAGLCLEDQMFPDAVHHAHFPNIICTPDKPYSHWCDIEIG